MYKLGFSVYASDFVYDGDYDPNEEICTIKWCIADLLDMMASKNIPLTDENVEAILDNGFAKVLRDRSIEEGWEIIDTLTFL